MEMADSQVDAMLLRTTLVDRKLYAQGNSIGFTADRHFDVQFSLDVICMSCVHCVADCSRRGS